MKGVPRGVFDRAVQASGAERYHKCFSSWNHLTAMVVGHLSGATSLRTLERTYNSQAHQHYHLGTGPLRRSTLADANAKRSMAPFEAVAQALMAQAHRTLRREGQALLYLLDSTPIPLAGRHFDAWTQANRTQRTQGLKLHLLIAQPGAKPLQCAFSAANVNDITYGKSLPIETGATYVFDKGYCDFGWWAAIDAAGARFVTRFKRNVALVRLRQRPVSAADQDVILADEVSTSRRASAASNAITATVRPCDGSPWPGRTTARPWCWRPMIWTRPPGSWPSTTRSAGASSCCSNGSSNT